MPNTPTTIIDEMVAASRGVAAIVMGDRRAPGHFDFSQRGLAGSFIAFLLATVFSAYLPVLTGSASGSGMPTGRLLLMAAFLFAVQLACSALVLRQLNRLDGFVPYMVADNWATFFVTVLSGVLGLFNLDSNFMLIVLGLLVLVIEVNIARLIVTLRPWQIVMLLIAQMVGVSIGLILVAVIFPLPPDLVTAPSP